MREKEREYIYIYIYIYIYMNGSEYLADIYIYIERKKDVYMYYIHI